MKYFLIIYIDSINKIQQVSNAIARSGDISVVSDPVSRMTEQGRYALTFFVIAPSENRVRDVLMPIAYVFPKLAQDNDLEAIFDELNKEYFNEQLECVITYDDLPGLLGSSMYEERTISINRLAIENVAKKPEYVPAILRYIIYHEMCHLVEQPIKIRVQHHERFSSLESNYNNINKIIKLMKPIEINNIMKNVWLVLKTLFIYIWRRDLRSQFLLGRLVGRFLI